MEKIRNLSIRKSIVLYVGTAVILSFLLSMICMWAVGEAQQSIWKKYPVFDTQLDRVTDTGQENQPRELFQKGGENQWGGNVRRGCSSVKPVRFLRYMVSSNDYNDRVCPFHMSFLPQQD